MMLLEHDAKTLLSSVGMTCPVGFLADTATETLPSDLQGPLVIKAQVPVGGRGKEGGIRLAADGAETQEALSDILGKSIKGHRVRACRIEQAVKGDEFYLAMKLLPSEGKLCCLFSQAGGVEIEDNTISLQRENIPFQPALAMEAFAKLTASVGEPAGNAVRQAAGVLVDAFFNFEATLIEINPLIVHEEGTWHAADAKFVVDLNALPRLPSVREIILEHAQFYPEAAVKLEQGFDFVIMEPNGDIGLITTGAGLSMQVADEFAARRHEVFNFCDMRTGGFRGNPDRLIYVLKSIAASGTVKATIVNIFAGITHLGEFASVLVDALAAVPEFNLPIVARLVGNGEDEGKAILQAASNEFHFERDLDLAMDLTVSLAERVSA